MSVDQPPELSRPESTYRLQFHGGFTFRDAVEIIPYLATLGITHVYASPYLKARAGSTHGYDVIDPCALNPEIGSPQDYQDFLDDLQRHGMSHILDIVPNHMGVGTNENAWWNDVLENGPASPYAHYFDINWKSPSHPALRDKVLLPVLGEPYQQVLEKGELQLHCDEGSFAVHNYDRRFPISPASYQAVISSANAKPPQDWEEYVGLFQGGVEARQKRRQLVTKSSGLEDFLANAAAGLNGHPGDPRSFDRLDKLLGEQHYRLAYWKDAPEQINYRRFFDINDLAALRMERPEVFQATHKFILQLLSEGKIAGLRIDHPDGLYDPLDYLQRLQRAYAQARHLPSTAPSQKALYVVVEKILASGESLPLQWPVDGTTGYDFLNQINGWFIDSANRGAFDEIYQQFTGIDAPFAQIAYEKKLLMLDTSFSGELQTLAGQLSELAQKSRRSGDFTSSALHDALRQIIACFPVYRSYIAGGKVSPNDQRDIERAIQQAKEKCASIDPLIFDFLGEFLLLTYPDAATEADREALRRFIGKFQQLTAPVTAKGIEDTAFYCYNRFVSLNEVGGDPDRFGITTEQLHQYLQDRQSHWPRALSPLSTHDTKRSEDVRARLNGLSEVPQMWNETVHRWARLNEKHKQALGEKQVPGRNEEYRLYQALLGAWPVDVTNPDAQFVKRINAYVLKALREAKVHTNWTDPDEKYENAVQDFARKILDPGGNAEFIDDLSRFAQWISLQGMRNSIAQSVLRLTCPGVPDTYQGTELWDLSLVDPDNRRAVDYRLRQRLLNEIAPALDDAANRARFIGEWSERLGDGKRKLFVTSILLRLRRQFSGLFSNGAYEPLQVTGKKSGHAVAFRRRYQDKTAIIIVSRFGSQWPLGGAPLGLKASAWLDTAVNIGALELRSMVDILTGRNITVSADDRIALANLPDYLPAWVLISDSLARLESDKNFVSEQNSP